MKLHIPLFKDLQLLQYNDGKLYIPLETFFEILKAQQQPLENAFRKDNFKKMHKDRIITVNDVAHFPLSVMIQFCYANREKQSVCSKLCSQIESRLCTRRDEDNIEGSILEIYHKVACFDFNKVPKLLSYSLNHFNKEPHQIPSLFDIHKCHFQPNEWQKICLFEWHFGLEYEQCLPLEEEIHNRQDYFQRLVDTSKLASTILKISKRAVTRRKYRQDVSDANQIELYFSHDRCHIPSIIENDLESEIQNTFSGFEGTVLVVDCPKKCRSQEHGAHVYVDAHAMSMTDRSHISTLISILMQKRHNLSCASVSFFQEGTFEPFQKGDGRPSRFMIRDMVEEGKLQDKCIGQLQADEIIRSNQHDSNTSDNPCEKCFHEAHQLKPLHWSTFEAEEEWMSDVPLEMQIIFETFISKNSIWKTKGLQDFVKGKIVRLYALYDSLLNLLNKKHFGIIQELNTSELMVNYHNITDTFQMTQMMGMTSSQNSAEKQWNARATDDLCYYNYAIRKWPLTYESESGKGAYKVSLRDCFKILMRDNLVTLTQKSNPEPGETRSGQICTIQGTDIGIPWNSTLFTEIHAENNCDGASDACSCIEPIPLKKNQLHDVLVKLSPKEEKQVKSVHQLCVWGLQAVWNHVYEDDQLSEMLLPNSSESSNDEDECVM